MFVLACIGGLASVWAFYAICSLMFAITKSSDIKTALTPKLPKDAFAGHVVWITGGSSGIGKEIALLLAERGARLILSSRGRKDLDAVAQECRARNPSVHVKVLPLDLNEQQSLATKAEEASKFFGPIDVLINNGGISTRAMAANCSVETDEFLTQVDYLSHVALTKTLTPAMEQIKEARIINTLSVCSKVGVPSRTAYCGAKFALKGWMDAFRIECILRGCSHIHILNVCLGSTNTSLPSRAVTNVKSKVVENFTDVDENILQGLDPAFVAERMLSVSYHKSVDECWLAKRKELILLYANQYVPQTAFKILSKSVAKEYAIEKSKDD